jgi:uncharacterized protein YcaQ
LAEARRIALAAQGFERQRPKAGVSASHVARAIRQIGLLQIDCVNVLVRAHYLVLFSRLGPYDQSHLDELIYTKRELTEQWAHEASIIPVETWPLLRHRMDTHRLRPYGFETVMLRHSDYVAWVLEQVRARGPLGADELPAPEGAERRLGEAWFGTIPRAVLEAYFGRGLLAIAKRQTNFARVFDLAERVIAAEHLGREIERVAAQRELIALAARAHGVGTAGDLADYYRMPIRDARLRIAELVSSGELREVRVEGWREPAYLHPEAKLPRQIHCSALLSPFDPVVWYRPRVLRLFDFDYRIEIYTPQAKRRWGYYVLPFLLGDRLVARVDLKADRAGGRLLVLAAHLEPDAGSDETADALAVELWELALWLGLDSVAVSRRGGLARGLRIAVENHFGHRAL